MSRRASVIGLLALAVTACSPNPNAAGVTDTGTVTGRLVNAAQPTQPIQQALVQIGLQTYRITPADNGGFSMPNVPIGTQPVQITAPGFQSYTASVVVHKDQTSDIGNMQPVALVPVGP